MSLAAVDLGATSGRVIVGRVGPDRLELHAVHRFPNRPVAGPDGLHWDIDGLYREVFEGLHRAVVAEPDLVSVGIDSWAVDYGLLRHGQLQGPPFHYRDGRTGAGVEAVHSVVTADALYAANGLQFLPFTTIYQLAVDQAEGRLDGDVGLLLIPDLLGYWLTGEQRAECTNASTTGLLDIRSGRWNLSLASALGLSPTLLPDLIEPGARIGPLRPEVARSLGSDRLPVVAVGSHDTASAVAAVPLTGPTSAYVCSGTWSLIGVETDAPIVTDAARQANFTNEAGVDGRNRFLRNVMGLWLVNECVESWRRMAMPVDLPALLVAAGEQTRSPVIFDVQHPSLLPAGDMPSRVTELAPELRGAAPPVILRSILESLAVAYSATLAELERVGNLTIDTVHIVGGASQNALLCQLLSNRSGRTVLAGPVEATAIGNLLVQARSAALVSGSLEDLRSIVARSIRPRVYRPA